MLGKLLEGAAWFATLSLATAGGLTFVPDGAWEAFPTALRPARAKLAEFGVAPTRYRAGFDGEKDGVLAANQGAAEGKDWKNVADVPLPEDAWSASTNVRIGERWKRVREVGETAFVENWSQNGATRLASEDWASERRLGSETPANPNSGTAEVGETRGTPDAGGAILDVIPWGSETPLGEMSSTTDAPGGAGEDDAIPPFDPAPSGVETGGATDGTGTPFPVIENLGAFGDVGGASVGVLSGDAPETGEIAPVAPSVDAVAGNDFNVDAGFNAPSNLLEQADAALTNDPEPLPPAAPVDEAAELRDALAAAATATTPKEIKTIFETLNRIRDERGARLTVEDAKALDAALDRLAFDVFYNPAQAILEPRWQTAPGESLASIAERLGTTPETLAEINGIKTPVDAPLPVGTTLKTVRGPASAEISISKKELTLRFNGLYAGRFALGVPEKSAALRGDFRVVEKLANPNCDAVDANGQTISIPGGAPENPLGVAWIALDGGVGLQGTNRPELVGQTISENGGFVFSNREIAQLSVLLPVGAVVAIVD